MSSNRCSEPTGQPAAFFDVDGTLVRSTIAHYYSYFRRSRMSPLAGSIWHSLFVIKCSYFLLLDRVDRNALNVVFYRQYKGLPADELRSKATDCHQHMIRPRLFVEVGPCIQQHRDEGCKIVLVTGSLDFVMTPLAEDLGVDHLIAASLQESDGRFTGALTTSPIAGLEKSHRIREYSQQNQIDLGMAHAYGDSIADLPMLETVGLPHAVNPDRALSRIAFERHWPVHRWMIRGQSNGVAH